MKSKVFFLFIFSLLAAYLSFAQFLPQEISQREEWEDFLLTAEIVQAEDIGEGVTKPIRVYLKKDDLEKEGVWKNPKGMQKGFLEGWQFEIAAYRMDKLLNLNMIPPTVEKEYEGKKGSLQLWAGHEYSLLQMMEENIPFPQKRLPHVTRMKYIARVFDSLIANEDRTQQNILYTKDWRMILIDHSRSFRASKPFTEKLVFGRRAEGRPMPFRQLPRQLVEKIKELTFESIKEAVAPYLEDKEIEAILARKKLILAEIEEMIQEKGENKVLY